MYCQSCGVQNIADTGVCSACGKPLSPYAPPRSVVADYPAGDMPVYAGFWKRVGAAFVDGIILAVVGAVVSVVLGENQGAYDFFGPGFFARSIIGWLYCTLMESSSMQATLGKQALGIQVTTLDGQRISFGRANGRYFGKVISFIILGIGFLMAGFTGKKQALHDMMAGTLVVNRR